MLRGDGEKQINLARSPIRDFRSRPRIPISSNVNNHSVHNSRFVHFFFSKKSKMRICEIGGYIFDYALAEVVSVFYNRYPNSFAKHVVSEDVLSRDVTEHTIVSRKLIVKKGSSFLKSVPKWLSRQTNVQFMPTLEESIFDRNTGTLVTHTRNVSWTNTLHMTERCVYRRLENVRTALDRTLVVQANCRFSGLVEQFLLRMFRASTGKTLLGYQEKLAERFGPKHHHHHNQMSAATATSGGTAATGLGAGHGQSQNHQQQQFGERAGDLMAKKKKTAAAGLM